VQCEHVVVNEVLGEASSLVRSVRSVHHLVELLVTDQVVLLALALENGHLLSMLHHQVLLESLALLFMVDLVQIL